MADRFTEASPVILEAIQAGATIDEAARGADVPVASLRRWLRDGRKGRDTYAAFAAAVDGARKDRREAERALEGPLSAEEADLLVAKAARKGSVPALRLWFEQCAAGESKHRADEARRLLESVFGDDDER